MQQPLTIQAQFRGPPDSGNGGYVAGAIAERFGKSLNLEIKPAIEVTLRAPIPLDEPMRVDQLDDNSLQVTLGETLIAQAHATDLALEVPTPPSFAAALAAQQQSPSFTRGINPLIEGGQGFHPICFCCGADVKRGEGLHVYAAPVEGFNGVAAAWRPSDALATDEGRLSDAMIWAALDCPGQFAFYADGILTGLLGRITGRVLRSVPADQNFVVIGWCLGVERSKHFAGTALFDEAGDLCAYSKQVWIGRRNLIDQLGIP